MLALLGMLTWQQASIYRDEMTFFSHVVSLNPAARDAHLNLAEALVQADRLEEGLAASRIALEQRPDFANAHSNVGRVLLLMERFDEAEKHLSRALALDPRSNFARQNMAELLRKQGRYEQAIEWFRAVLDHDPEYALAHAGLGDALFYLNRYEESVESLTRFLALQPDSSVTGPLRILLGQALQKLARPDDAAKQYERALEIDPRNTDALDRLAMIRFGQKRYEETLSLYQKLAAINPDGAQVHANMGAVLHFLGRPAEALRNFERAFSLDPSLEMARTGLEEMRKIVRQGGR